jgi:acyl carrier protein
LPLKSSSKIWQKVTGRISRTTLGIEISKLEARLRANWRLLVKNSLPDNANFPLLACWKDLAATGIPTILFKAPGFELRGEFDYLNHVLKLAGQKKNVAVRSVDDANHTFSNRAGRAAVRQHVESWLETNFPLADVEEAVEGISPSRANAAQIFQAVPPPSPPDTKTLTDDLTLLDSGLDSLCFATLVVRLEISLGVDPFSADEDIRFPVTFGDFVSFYENAAR